MLQMQLYQLLRYSSLISGNEMVTKNRQSRRLSCRCLNEVFYRGKITKFSSEKQGRGFFNYSYTKC